MSVKIQQLTTVCIGKNIQHAPDLRSRSLMWLVSRMSRVLVESLWSIMSSMISAHTCVFHLHNVNFTAIRLCEHTLCWQTVLKRRDPAHFCPNYYQIETPHKTKRSNANAHSYPLNPQSCTFLPIVPNRNTTINLCAKQCLLSNVLKLRQQ